MPSAAEIARGLTKAQRERLLAEEDGACPAGVAFAFMAMGLIAEHPTDPDGWVLSPLGLAVRAELLKDAGDA